MKANELMIGDWVKTPDGNGIIRLINAIDERFVVRVKGMDCRFLPDVVEPIPLTDEILEKNGFVYISKGMLYSYYSYAADGYIKVILSDLLDGEWELSIDNYDKFNDSHTQYTNNRCFLKVHELQHALKLCGIEKEIQL